MMGSWILRRKRSVRGGIGLLWLLLFVGGRGCRGLRRFRGRDGAVGCRGRLLGLEVRCESRMGLETKVWMMMGMGISDSDPL